MEHMISTRRLANLNEGHIHFIISGARKNVLFIVKMKILVLIRWSYRFFKSCWLLNVERLSCFAYIVQSLLNT